MELEVNDTARVEVTRIQNNNLVSETTPWPNVDALVLSDTYSTNAPTLGDGVEVKVTEIKGTIAFVKQTSNPLNLYREGEEIEVVGETPQGLNVSESNFRQADNIEGGIVIGASPGDRVTAEIKKIRDGIAYAVTKELLEKGLGSGDVVKGRTVAGTSTAKLSSYDFSVVLDRYAQISTEVQLKICEVGETTTATVVSSGDLPKVDGVVEGKTIAGTSTAKLSGYDYQIEIDRFAQISTPVSIRICDVGETTTGTVIDSGSLPEIGDVVGGKYTPEDNTVSVNAGYTVQVDCPLSFEWEVKVRICDIDESNIEGEVQNLDELPIPGSVLRAEVEYRQTRAKDCDTGRTLRLNHKGDARGEAKILIQNCTEKDNPVGAVQHYRTFPQEGDIVRGKIRKGNPLAHVQDGRYDVELQQIPKWTTSVNIEITSVDTRRVSGRIVTNSDSEVNYAGLNTEQGELIGSKNSILSNSRL